MKNQDHPNKITVKLNIVFIIPLVLSFLFFSCENRGTSNNLVPENELVDILTELYITDGLLIIPHIRNNFSSKDSILNQIDVINKHGFTKEIMDRTLRYYFEKKPKKLENIYDQVLTRLSEKQVLIDKELAFRGQNPSNIWNKDAFIYLPEAGPKNQVWFKIAVKDTGSYLLDFTSTVFRDDKSSNPRVTVFFWHSDSSKKENRISWDEVALPRDGESHIYTMTAKNTDTTFKFIGGWLMNSDPKEGRWAKHAKFENIFLRKAEAK